MKFTLRNWRMSTFGDWRIPRSPWRWEHRQSNESVLDQVLEQIPEVDQIFERLNEHYGVPPLEEQEE